MIIALGLGLAGCGGNDAEIKQYVQKHEMKDVQAAAFTACAKDLRVNKPVFLQGEKYMVMKDVPLDICACQVKTMMTVFKDKRYKGHTNFAEYMATFTKKKPPHIPKKDLVAGLKPRVARRQLIESLNSCVTTYVGEHEKQAAELYKMVPVKKKKEKKPKENKTADAKSS